MPKIGLPELAIILVIILVIFGAGRLPEIGSAMGRAIRSFKKGVSSDDEEAKGQAKAEATLKSEVKDETKKAGS